MKLPVAAAVAILERLLPIVDTLVKEIDLIKSDNPEAWTQVSTHWKTSVSRWKSLDEE